MSRSQVIRPAGTAIVSRPQSGRWTLLRVADPRSASCAALHRLGGDRLFLSHPGTCRARGGDGPVTTVINIGWVAIRKDQGKTPVIVHNQGISRQTANFRSAPVPGRSNAQTCRSHRHASKSDNREPKPPNQGRKPQQSCLIKAYQGKRRFFKLPFIRPTHPLDGAERQSQGRNVSQGKFLSRGRIQVRASVTTNLPLCVKNPPSRHDQGSIKAENPSNQGKSCLIKANANLSERARPGRSNDRTGRSHRHAQTLGSPTPRNPKSVPATAQSRQKPQQSCFIKPYQGIRQKTPVSLELLWRSEVGISSSHHLCDSAS